MQMTGTVTEGYWQVEVVEPVVHTAVVGLPCIRHNPAEALIT